MAINVMEYGHACYEVCPRPDVSSVGDIEAVGSFVVFGGFIN